MKIIQKAEGIELGDFEPVEAYKVAMKIESDGIKFYLKAQEIIANQATKDVFRNLINEEDKHLNLFKDMLKQYIKENKLEIDIESGAEEELFDSITTSVFGDILDIEKDLKNVGDNKQAAKLAQRIEINSINFYKALLSNTTREESKQIIKKIISEEQNHLKTFVEYEKQLAG